MSSRRSTPKAQQPGQEVEDGVVEVEALALQLPEHPCHRLPREERGGVQGEGLLICGELQEADGVPFTNERASLLCSSLLRLQPWVSMSRLMPSLERIQPATLSSS
jgi:hypothetical protein